jgi:hypothetical protein
MKEIWKQSNGAARRAIISGGLAQALFLLPFMLALLIPVWDRGGLFFLLFWPASLFLLVRTVVQSTVASREGLWWRSDRGKRFVCVLFGLPFLLLVLTAGLLMKR